MANRVPQKPAKTRKTPAKALRDSAIVASSLAGKTNMAIAEDMGIDRETVAKVLNSEDVKKLSQEIDGQLSKGIAAAVKNILREVIKFNNVGLSKELLQNFGSMRSSLKLEHTGKDGAPLGSRTDAEIDERIKMLLGKAGK